MRLSSRLTRISVKLVFLGTLSLAAMAPALAQASLVGQGVTVTYREDGLPDVVDTPLTVVDPGHELAFGDGSNLDSEGLLLEDEFIDIGAASIRYHVRGGGNALGGGYSDAGHGPTARLIFSDLSFLPDTLVGIGIVLQDVIGVTASEVSFTQDSVTLWLGNIGVLDAAVLGDITLNLQTRPIGPAPIPEPATMVLLGIGFAGLGLYRRFNR